MTKPTLKKRPRELGVARLRLGHHEHVPLARQLADAVRLRTGDVDRALARVALVVEVHDLVGEALQRAFGDGDEPHRLVQPTEPERGLEQVLEVLEVLGDLLTPADAPHRGHQADRLVGLDHARETTPMLPPGPREPAALQTVEWIVRPTALLRRAHARYGEPFTLRTAWMDAPLVLTSDPDEIKRVYAAPAGRARGR